MRVLADTDAGFASTDPPSSRFTIPRKGRDSWMLLVIPRRLKSQTSERAYIYIYIRSGSARTAPWEAAYADGNANFMRFRRRSYASPPSPRPIRGYAIKPAIIVRTFLSRERGSAALRDKPPSGWTES